ncbi:MAG: 6,7-dimethyl-8-ribityllumazine synthase [Planctomycetales bacterium]|nr:6,7-dimethyl-8-ribityllumazine synthase [Planctomycetales bacterium]
MRILKGELEPVDGDYIIVVSKYNHMITDRLLEGALATLAEHGVADSQIVVAHVPGAWELPVVAARFAARGAAAIICLGAVIKGETTHDQHINRQVSHSLGELMMQTGVPVAFGLLTCNSLEQAMNRAGGRVGNKGNECALAALEMAHLMGQLPG